MNFHSIYCHGFARVAACTIVSSVANPTANATAIIDAASACHEKSVAVAVFPELCLSGYAIEDLLLQDALLDATERALATVVEASTRFMSVLVVGAPLRQGGRIYNCAVVVHRGRVLGVVPKTYVPTYREFYEARHFGSGKDVAGREIAIGTVRAPFAGGIADRLSLPLGQPSRGDRDRDGRSFRIGARMVHLTEWEIKWPTTTLTPGSRRH